MQSPIKDLDKYTKKFVNLVNSTTKSMSILGKKILDEILMTNKIIEGVSDVSRVKTMKHVITIHFSNCT